MLGWFLRFVGVLALVVVTWNPEGRSYVHWVSDFETGSWRAAITAPKAFLGVVLTIGWVAAFTISWKSLGVVATGLLGALIGTGLWMVIDWSGAALSGRAISWIVLVAIAVMLATAMSWASLRAVFASDDGDVPGADPS